VQHESLLEPLLLRTEVKYGTIAGYKCMAPYGTNGTIARYKANMKAREYGVDHKIQPQSMQ